MGTKSLNGKKIKKGKGGRFNLVDSG
ncbi:hypothetical protein PBAL39_22425 [Pedobacter sp. BAL39]|nr:hypothetical protein PBAL39_22425 [Pedobacter sp. BAL39]